MATRKKAAKKHPVKKAAKKASSRKPRLICYECGRIVTINDWGAAESSMICCGRVMGKK
ncbi:MAG: hypothetical protein AB1439_03945 [candidate division FCPU426 bacterium]